MRAREFISRRLREDRNVTVNIPITIRIPSGAGDPEVAVDSDPKDPQELDPNPIMVSPLQQELELKKAEVGKDSPIIRDLTQDEIPQEETAQPAEIGAPRKVRANRPRNLARG
jgi:hypothetical protein